VKKETFGRDVVTMPVYLYKLLPFGTRPAHCPGCGKEESGFDSPAAMKWRVTYMEVFDADDEGTEPAHSHLPGRYLRVRCNRCRFTFQTQVYEDRDTK